MKAQAITDPCIVRKRWARCFYIINLFPDPLWQAQLSHNFFSHRCHRQWCHPTLKTCMVITASLVASHSLASESCYFLLFQRDQSSAKLRMVLSNLVLLSTIVGCIKVHFAIRNCSAKCLTRNYITLICVFSDREMSPSL